MLTQIENSVLVVEPPFVAPWRFSHEGCFPLDSPTDIRNRMRKDGGRFLQGLQEAGWDTETPAIPSECFTAELRQSKEKRATGIARNPLICLVAGPGFEPGTFGL